MVNTKTKFPRGINSDQVISCMFKADGQTTGRAPGPGLKPGGPQISVREFIRRGTRGPRLQALKLLGWARPKNFKP